MQNPLSHINSFLNNVPEGYRGANLVFAYYAAYPGIFSIDFLNQLWFFFQDFEKDGKPKKIPFMVISDLIQSGLCEEIGFELFEMNEAVSDLLRKNIFELCGERRVNILYSEYDLASICLEYAEQFYKYSRPHLYDFFYWKSIFALNPERGNKEIKEIVTQDITYKNKRSTAHIYLELARIQSDLSHQNKDINKLPLFSTEKKNDSIDIDDVTLVKLIRKILGLKQEEYSEEINSSFKEVNWLIEDCIKSGIPRLDLSNYGISDLSEFPGLFNCTHLKSLVLKSNQIKDISFVEHLPSLQTLDLNGNQVQNFSPLENLSNLKSLSLERTQISDISFLKNLTSLQSLNLSGNKIIDYSFLEKLTVLESLDLSNNSINNYSFLQKINRLKTLGLSGNKLTDVQFLKNFKELKSLNLSGNQLKLFPESLLEELPALELLYLKGNNIENIPKEIFSKDGNVFKDVFNFMQGFKEVTYLQEANMILIGNDEVGKTSICLKLLDKNAPLPKTEERTQGIDLAVGTYKVEGLSPEITGLSAPITFNLHIWDFGGQGKYRELQQLFCFPKSLYLFVTSFDDQPTKEDYVGFEYWLSMVNTYNFDKGNQKHSPIIFVVNKIDKEIKLIDENGICRAFSNIYPEFIKISCKKLTNFSSLETTIKKVLPLVSDDIFKTPFPSSWLKVKNLLKEIEKKGEVHISYNEYEKICLQENIDSSAANTLIQTLNGMGYVLYYGNIVYLNDWVILSPKWVKDSIYRVLDSTLIREAKFFPAYFPLVWNDYIPPESLYKKHRKKAKTLARARKYTNTEHQKLLALMKAYEICYELKDISGQPYYIIPALFGEKPEEIIPASLKTYDYQIRFKFDPFIPAGSLNKLIVRLHRNIYGGNLVWKHGVILHDSTTEAFAELTEIWQDKMIFLKLKGSDVKGLYQLILKTLKALNKQLKETKFLAKLDFEADIFHGGNWINGEIRKILNLEKYRFMDEAVVTILENSHYLDSNRDILNSILEAEIEKQRQLIVENYSQRGVTNDPMERENIKQRIEDYEEKIIYLESQIRGKSTVHTEMEGEGLRMETELFEIELGLDEAVFEERGSTTVLADETVKLWTRENRIGISKGEIKHSKPRGKKIHILDVPIRCVAHVHPECELSWFRLTVKFSGGAIIKEMSPDEVKGEPIKIVTKVNKSFSLEVSKIKLGSKYSAEESKEQQVYFPEITSSGIGFSSAIWDFKSVGKNKIHVDKPLRLILEIPDQDQQFDVKSIESKFIIRAEIQHKTWGWIPVVGRKNYKLDI